MRGKRIGSLAAAVYSVRKKAFYEWLKAYCNIFLFYYVENEHFAVCYFVLIHGLKEKLLINDKFDENTNYLLELGDSRYISA